MQTQPLQSFRLAGSFRLAHSTQAIAVCKRIRELFVGTVQARERGYEVGRCSFNVKGGMIKVEMHFLPDNLDVIKTADWVIDLGPEGDEGGGRTIAESTPEQVAKNKASHTGKH